VPYSIRHPKQGSKGIVHFDATLKPVTIDYNPDPLPPMVSVFDGTMRLAALPDGSLVVSDLVFSGEGGILFLRMRFLVSIAFSGYERR
jgi:hypothetical protein